MRAWAYYNEIDPFAAEQLRVHMAAGRIMPGVVDERSIEDVRPDDLRGFTQVNFFAGIGVWSYALRRAGWPDERPAWTGSCPCQPFSAAGKGKGFDDERHLWPSMHWLVGQRRPVVVFGEQSASSDANDWIDLVQADVEALGYAFGACAFPAASVGAPNIRDRAYWVAHTNSECLETSEQFGTSGWVKPADSGAAFGLDYSERERQQAGRAGDYRGNVRQQPCAAGQDGWLAHANGERSQGGISWGADSQWENLDRPSGRSSTDSRPGPVNGFWRDADWLLCRDGKWRPVKPSLKPLVNGAASRVGRIRTYGNALNAEAATAFVRAYMMGCQNV
ncbi:DNA cytosine methyltransferase [Enterobacter hormaechei]|uniref:DNA cytosine methyltransferase n=1 Tax=Enterobacter hormaechei TaxID=158836 RepID=UPI00331646ED